MRSQSNSSGSAKEKEGKYTKNTNKGSSNKNHDKEPREKSSKSGSSSKGSHKENSSMDTSSAPLVPPIIGKLIVIFKVYIHNRHINIEFNFHSFFSYAQQHHEGSN